MDYNLAHILLRQLVGNLSSDSEDNDSDSDDVVSVNNGQLSNFLAPSPFKTNSNSDVPYPFGTFSPF